VLPRAVLACSVLLATSCSDSKQEFCGKPIFLNRGGGTYVSGPEDATTNTTGLVRGAPAMIAAASIGDDAWARALACVAADFAPFAATVTASNPGDVDHIEIVVVDDMLELGPAYEGALSAATVGCSGENTIAFLDWTFQDGADLCPRLSYQAGTLLGLDNVRRLPADVMADEPHPSGDAEAKTFVAEFAECTPPLNGPPGCACGGTQQNSYERLLELLGPACE
jgi:hypothetical protein